MKRILWAVGSWAVLGLFLSLLNPAKMPVVGLIVPFMLLFVALYTTWAVVQAANARIAGKEPAEVVRVRRRLGVVLCGCAVLLLIMQSLGQLTFKDVVTLLAIITLGYFFAARNRVSAAKP